LPHQTNVINHPYDAVHDVASRRDFLWHLHKSAAKQGKNKHQFETRDDIVARRVHV
jgi:hypothetical protein